MKFYRYPSLLNLSESTYQNYSSLEVFQLYKPANLNHYLLDRNQNDSQLCIATEKIHGCNLQIHFEKNGEHRFGSRSQYTGNVFRGVDLPLLLKSVVICSKRLFQEFVDLNTNVESMTVYGELFGGIYYGEVAPFATTMQKGINYIPHNEFALFDVAIHFQDLDSQDNTYYLSYEAISNFYRYPRDENGHPIKDIFFPPIVRIGSWQEMLDTDNHFESLVPYKLLPPGSKFPLDDNTCEGIVIRPMHGDIYSQGKRILIKSKNSKWSERRNSEGSGNWKKNNRTEYDHPLRATLAQYLITNRLDNILSHQETKLNWENIGYFSGLLTKDILEEAIRDGVVPLDWKQNEELKPLGKWLVQQSKDLIHEYLAA